MVVRPHFRARRGSVIVLVLVTIVLASLMLVRFMEESSLELIVATRDADERSLRADAYDALEAGLAVIAQIREIDGNALHSPEQGWADPYAYAGIEPREGVGVEFEFEDESGKLSLPKITPQRLQMLFETLGLSTYDAGRAMDAFFAWTDPKYSPVNWESAPDAYSRETPAYKVPQRALRSFDEIRSIAVLRDFFYDADGNPTPLNAAFQQCVSLYSFSNTNINSAPEILLTSNQLDSTQVANIRGYLDGSVRRPAGRLPYFQDMKEVRELVGGAAPLDGFATNIHCLRVIVHVRDGAAQMRLTALVTTENDVTFPSAVPSPSDQQGASATTQTQTGQTRTGTSSQSSQTQAAQGAQENLNYPFKILEIHEDHGSAVSVP